MLNRELTTGTYRPSNHFQSIREHAAVCFEDDEMLVAVTGPAGDGESEAYAKLFAASPALLQACKRALADLEGYTGTYHESLPPYRRNEKPALTTIRELTAAIKAAEPDWK